MGSKDQNPFPLNYAVLNQEAFQIDTFSSDKSLHNKDDNIFKSQS